MKTEGFYWTRKASLEALSSCLKYHGFKLSDNKALLLDSLEILDTGNAKQYVTNFSVHDRNGSIETCDLLSSNILYVLIQHPTCVGYIYAIPYETGDELSSIIETLKKSGFKPLRRHVLSEEKKDAKQALEEVKRLLNTPKEVPNEPKVPIELQARAHGKSAEKCGRCEGIHQLAERNRKLEDEIYESHQEIEELKKELYQTKENFGKLMARLRDSEIDNNRLKKDLAAHIDNNHLLFDQVCHLEKELKAANTDLLKNEATNKELLVQLKQQKEENAKLHEQNERQTEIIVKKNKEIQILRQGYGDEGADKLRFLKESVEKYKKLFEDKAIEVKQWQECAERWKEAYERFFNQNKAN